MYRRFKETKTEIMEITVDVLDDVLNELEMLRKGEHHEVANKIRKYGKEHLKVLISVLELPKTISDQLIEFNLLDDVESLNFENIAIKTGEIKSIISQFKTDGIINENEYNQLYFVGDDFDLLYLKYYAISQGTKIFPFYPEKLIQSVYTKFEDIILGNFTKYKFNTRFDKTPGDKSQLITIGELIGHETAKAEPSPDGRYTYTLELGRPMDWERELYEDSPESLRYRANVKYLSDGYVSKITFSSSEEKERVLEHLSSREDNLKLIGIELILKEESSWNNDGVKLSKLGKFEEAIECYDKAIEINPNFFLAWGNKGLALSNLKRYEETIECFDKIIDIEPRDFQGYENKGKALLNLKKNEEAIRCFDKAIELKPTSWVLWDNKGRALFNLQKFEDAIECFNKAIEDNPMNVETWNIKGMALDNLDKYKEAVESFDRAVEINPELEEVWANKGITLSKLNKLEDAIECWDRVLEINPKNKIACIVKGDVLSHLGRHDEAIECCEKALEIDPNFDGTWYYKACFESKRGNIDDAITSLKKAIEINDECIERANRDKDFDNIKDDKRFTQLLNVLYSE
jgi:tetratricopeptide (TPR) repeat protein